MSESNGDLVRRHFDAASRRDYEAAIAGWADDIELVLKNAIFTADFYKGKSAVVRFFGDWFRTFDGGPHFDVVDLRENGDRVALAAHATARGSQSGVEVSTDYFYVYTLRDGLITRIEFFEEWPQALTAAGVDG